MCETNYLVSRLDKNHFCVNSEILELQIWRKKRVNYDKFEFVKKLRKWNILPMCILFLPFDRCYMILPCYLQSIYIICIIYRLSIWFFKVDSNLHVQGSKFGGKFDKFGGKPFKKLSSAEFTEVVFSMSACQQLSLLSIKSSCPYHGYL